MQKYVKAMREAGAPPVTTYTVITAARGIVSARDRSLLVENGGHIALSETWAQSLFRRMGMVKRKATTKKKKLSRQEFEEYKRRFLSQVSGII